MRRRQKLSRKRSKKIFKRGAALMHKRNLMSASYAMRGGIRM